MSNEERRNSFRFPLREELRGAVIEARSRRLPVELIDQSAEGFSVKASRDIDISLDEVVVIETWAGRCEAVVARLADCRDYRRVGLQRISDITVCSRRSQWLPAWLKDRLPLLDRQPFRDKLPLQQDQRSRNRLAWVIASIAATILAAAGWTFKPAAKPATLSNQRLSSVAVTDDALAIDPDIEPAEDNAASLQLSSLTTSTAPGNASGPIGQAITTQAPGGSASPTATDAKSTAADSDRPPQAMLERLAALRTSKVANDLALSEHQKLEISRLLKKVASEVSRARTRLGGKSRAAREAKLGSIMLDAEAQAKAILNPEQQARWLSQ